MHSPFETYAAASPSLDPKFVELRREIFGSGKPWINPTPDTLFSKENQKFMGMPARALAPALGWELRPWTQPGSPATLFDALKSKREWDLCQVNCVSPDEVESFRYHSRRLRCFVAEYPFPIRVIRGGRSFEDYLATRDHGFNKEVARRRRRAERDGLTFKTELRWEDLERVLEARERSFSNGNDYTKSREFREFLRRYREESKKIGTWTEVGLFHGDKCVAYDLSFRTHPKSTVVHVYQTAFDPAYSVYSPGNITFDKALENLFAQGFELLDLMGEMPYFKSFTQETLNFSRVIVFSPGIRGRILATACHAKELKAIVAERRAARA